VAVSGFPQAMARLVPLFCRRKIKDLQYGFESFAVDYAKRWRNWLSNWRFRAPPV
jgi:hypothetical protein